MFKLLLSIAITSVVAVLAILAFSLLYDSNVVYDGPVYPRAASTKPLLPINTNPIPVKESCFDVENRVLLSTERLSACNEASQCKMVWNANIDSVRVINEANTVEFDRLADEVAASCGRRVYNPSIPVGEDEYKPELYCENQLCGYRRTLVETGKQRLYRETLSIIQETSDIEAQ